ncbi:MAG: PolC-type polymerase [Evtepia sp.]|jgi:DNA polymerase-3 subunit alpha (Gram-positive type)|nr:PolC-type polymerase [Evtepia sp.]
MTEQKLPFLEMFSAYCPLENVRQIIEQWWILRAVIDPCTRNIEAEISSEEEPNASLLILLEKEIAAVYHMNKVVLRWNQEDREGALQESSNTADEELEEDVFQRTERLRRQAMQQVEAARPKEHKQGKQKQIFGSRAIRKSPVPMCQLELDMDIVAIEGDVFFVDHKDLKKRNAYVICFDVTDYTGSIRVTKFMPKEEGQVIVDAVQKGQRLLIQGRLNINRFDNDLVLEPQLIQRIEKVNKQDDAERKRVELHLHTKMSTMDALTDTKKVVARAIEWGHPAIAITDHGIVQSFPDAWNAGKGKIKVLLGIEAYFLNNVDEKLVVRGPANGSFDAPIVAFDIETTGLNPKRDRLTEIGAVILENGQVMKKFQTFVNPDCPIPQEIVRLTGITDEMVEDAPSQEEAIRAFLDFAGNYPLAAHNADFDMGFMKEGCARYGMPFSLSSIDTLAMAQNLLPDLGRYKLNLVARHLDLPDFNHHRASDDAITVAYMLLPFFRMLKEQGVDCIEKINGTMEKYNAIGKGKRMPRHLIILVKNKIGLRNLYKLVSISHLEYFKRVPIMPKSLINENREGLIMGSGCEAGEVYQAVIRGKSWEELKRIASWYDFLEIQPLSNNAFMLRPDKNGRTQADSLEQIREWNRTIVRLGEELGKPVCATGDVHFMDPEDEIYRKILLDTKGFDDADAPNPLYYRTTEEMLKEFSYLGEETAFKVVVENTNLVAQWCEEVKPLPDGLFTPKLNNSVEELQELVWSKTNELYGEHPPEIVIKRVQAELKDIIDCQYDVIYMSAQKLVQDSLDHGYLVGSRGSVGSSIVAYMSGITEVNSLPSHYRCPKCKHSDFEVGESYGCGADMPDEQCPVCGTSYQKDGFNIPFETFLGFGGDKVPDIDLNFSGEYQSSAHKYTFELFGSNHVFRAGTVGTVAEKTAFGYVKKYLAARNMQVTRAEENRLAQGCTGVKRTTGQHPGGMVVIPQDKEIYDFCPVQHPADDTGTEIITTHFEYHSMESNLLKLDILGHDDPTMIRMLEDLTGVNAREIALDDPDTMSLFISSEKLGFTDDEVLGKTGAVAIPEFGTGFVRGMLEDTCPDQFDTLVRISGFSHGTDVWLGNARDLILSGTATVNQAIGCRDDIMIYLIGLGMEEKRAFKIMESVRKGKGLPDGAEQEMQGLGVPGWYIESCKKIAYLFPKAHAVAYVMMAFRIAWFKVHRPLAFYAAYFSIRAKAFDATVMCQGKDALLRKRKAILAKEKDATAVEEDMLVTMEVCYEFYLRGFTFDRIDLYSSHATLFRVDQEKESLLPPFVSVPGLGETAAVSIVENRKGRPFISIEEFLDACPKVSKNHVEQLRLSGALEDLPETSQLCLF